MRSNRDQIVLACKSEAKTALQLESEVVMAESTLKNLLGVMVADGALVRSQANNKRKTRMYLAVIPLQLENPRQTPAEIESAVLQNAFTSAPLVRLE